MEEFLAEAIIPVERIHIDHFKFDVSFGYRVVAKTQECHLSDSLPSEFTVPSCQYVLNGTIQPTNETLVMDSISNLDDENTINSIINADISPIYSQPVSQDSNTTENATIPDTNTTDSNVTKEAKEAKPVEWEIKKNGSEIFTKIEELNTLNSSREFKFKIGEKND